MNLRTMSYAVPLFLFILCWAVYGNTLHNPFSIDDHGIYTAAELGHQSLRRYFIPDVKEINGPGEIQTTAPTYRPLSKILWTVTYRLFGDNPVGYHAFNIILFWISCCLLFFFILTYLGRPVTAVAATILFCVHPYQGILMNSLPTILISAGMILTLSAMILFKIGLDRPNDQAGWTALSLMVALGSFLFHETAAAFPVYLMALLIFARGFRFQQALKAAFPFFLLVGIYVVFRMKFASLKGALLDQAHFYQVGFLDYAATFAKLVGWYFSQLMSPSGVVLFWTTPVMRSGHWSYIAGLLAWAALLGFLFYRVRSNVVRWGLAWLIIGFAPVAFACLFRLSEGLCIESVWLIFPSVGYFLILGYGLDQLWQSRQMAGMTALIAMTLLLALSSVIYNRIWSNEIRYCFYALEKAPDYRSNYFWLGTALMREGRYDLARFYLPQGLSSKVYNRQIYNNLGIMDLDEHKPEQAEKNFLLAIQENPSHTLAFDYLGKIYFDRNDFAKAEDILTQALKINPRDTTARLTLASVKIETRNLPEAQRLYRANLQIDPFHRDTWLAQLQFSITHDAERVPEVTQEITQTQHDSRLLTAVGEILAQYQYLPLAFQVFEQALVVNPKDKEIYISLGKFLGNLNRFDEAVKIWRAGEALDPADARFSALIAQADSLRTSLSINQN